MPARGARNPVRWAKISAKKLVVDCDPKASGKREAELTTVLNDLAKQYQKCTHSDSGASAEHFHDHFVKSLRAIAKNVPPTAEQVANNAPNAVNAVNANSTALVKTNTAVNPNNATTVPAPVNSTALVMANAGNMNPVAINNNNNNGPAGIATSFRVDTNGPSTTRLHYPGYTSEFMFNDSGTVQVHHAYVPAGTPAFVQPVAAPANSTGANGGTQDKNEDSPSKRPVPLDMYL